MSLLHGYRPDLDTLSEDWVASWLARLGISGQPAATLETLEQLTSAHLDRIPFENLSVFCGAVPDLDLGAVTKKIIDQRRGGYCFEVNLLLCAGLRALGFDVRLLMARVMWQRDHPGPRTHCVCVVTIGSALYLVDVGFGGPGPTRPVRIADDAHGTGHDPTLRTYHRPGQGIVLSRCSDTGDWSDLYAFVDEPTQLSDLMAGNWLAATMPRSMFARTIVVVRQIGETRRILEGGAFREITEGSLVRSTQLRRAETLIDCLKSEFGLAPDPPLRDAMIRKLAFA